MRVTPDLLRALRTSNPDGWAPLLDGVSPDFLANVLHETGRLYSLRESMNYTPSALLRVFPSHFAPATAQALGRIDGPNGPLRAADQWWIAERAYGGRMGNAATGHGDGFMFRGAGCLMTTGRDNVAAFAAVSKWAGTLPALVDSMATPAGAAASARAWWALAGCDAMVDPAAIRRRVNGGTNGLPEVLALRAEIMGNV